MNLDTIHYNTRVPILKVFVILLGLTFAEVYSAEPLEWLYDVEVEVAERSRTSAETAIKQALEVCLMRVSGLDQVKEFELAREALEDPSAYLLQYRYKTVTNAIGEEKDVLEANFDKQLIKKLSREAQFPIWPSDRPTILMWVAKRTATDSDILRTGTSRSVRLVQRAKERGVEIILPLMDLTDRKLVAASSIEGRFWVDVLDASSRYSADVILAAVSHENIFGEARLHVTLWFEGEEESTVIDQVESSSVGMVALDLAVGFLVDRLSIPRRTQYNHSLQVGNIDSVRAYAQLLEYLGQKEFIDRVEVASYQNKLLVLDVYTPSSAERLVTLMKSDLLSPSAHSSSSDVFDIDLKFAWQGPR